MDVEPVRRRLARIMETTPDSITVTSHPEGVSMDFQYDTYLKTQIQSSVVYHEDDEVFRELRIRLPEYSNQAKSGSEAKEIERFLSDHLQRFVDGQMQEALMAEFWARVEIAASGFVMHVEGRDVPEESGFQLLKALKSQYEPPDPEKLYSEFSDDGR